MKPEEIRQQNVDRVFTTPLPYDWRSLATFGPMVGMALIVIAVLLMLKIDVLSLRGLLIIVLSAGLTGLLSRWIHQLLQPPVRHYVVAFTAPRWDAQLAEPIEIDSQDKTYFVENTPAVKVTTAGEWVRLELRSGVSTYILADDFIALSGTKKPTKP